MKRKKRDSRLFLSGFGLILVGFLGSALAKQYFRENPEDSLAVGLMELVHADARMPLSGQIVSFFASYGVYVGLAGILVVFFAVARR